MRYEEFSFLSISILVALGVDAVLCWLLIPMYGSIGAAIATGFSAALANGAFFLRSRTVM